MLSVGAKTQARQGMLLLFLCTVMWSISGALIKQIPWHPLAIAGSRSLIAGCVMALYIRLSGLRFRINRTVVISGVLISGMFMCFTTANKMTTAANAIVIQSSAPAFILLYNVTLGKQRVRRLDALTVALTMIGIMLFFLDQLTLGRLLGNAIALLSGLLLAASYIVTCRADQESCMNGILLAHLLTALIGLPVLLASDTPWSGGTVGCVLLLGIVQLGIPYVLYGLAVRHCPPLACSLIGMMEAVLNPTWVFCFNGERPSALALFGGALVLCSIAFWAIWSQRLERRDDIPTKSQEVGV